MKLRFVSFKRDKIVDPISSELGYSVMVPSPTSEYHFACDELGFEIYIHTEIGVNVNSKLEQIFKEKIEIVQ